MQQSKTYASGVGVTTPIQSTQFKNLVNGAYQDLVHQLKNHLGENDTHPMYGRSIIDYSADGQKQLVTTLSNQYKLAIANALKQNTIQLQHITDPGQNNEGQPLSPFAIVKNATSWSLSNYEAFNTQHKDADPQINTDYANALGQFSASIDAAIKVVVDTAITKVKEHEKTTEYQVKLKRQRLVMPLATAAVYTLPITGLIAGSVLANESLLLQDQVHALLDTLPQDVIKATAQQYYSPGCEVHAITVITNTHHGYNFLWNPALNDAQRLAVEQIRNMYDLQTRYGAGGGILLALSIIAMFTVWTMMYGDQTQNWVKAQREQLIDTVLADGQFASTFTMEQPFIAPASSTIIAENKVDQTKLAIQMAKDDVQLNTKVCLLLGALAHEQKLQASKT